jgi:hypothetical protein
MSEDFWSYFPGLPHRAVMSAIGIIERNEWPSTLDYIREVAEREARADARGPHERHVNLMAHCYLCRIEAGAQTDRLTYDDDDECTCAHPYHKHVPSDGEAGACVGTSDDLPEYGLPPGLPCLCEGFTRGDD